MSCAKSSRQPSATALAGDGSFDAASALPRSRLRWRCSRAVRAAASLALTLPAAKSPK